MPDSCELLFKMQLRWNDPEDFAATCEFFLRAKAIVITSKLKGQNIVINSSLKLKDCFDTSTFTDDKGKEHQMHISRIQIFEHKNEEYFALGMRDGSVVIKPTGSILSNTIYDYLASPEETVESDGREKITFLGYNFPGKLMIGSSQGRITFYEIEKK